jgi:two-component system nitrate/nitrite sensor histidine kinase NarX
MKDPTTRPDDAAADCPTDEQICAIVRNERRLIAAAVHDSVAQTLTFVNMRLPLIEDALLAHDDALVRRYLCELRDAVGVAHTSLREIVTELRTRIDPRGLLPALDGLAAKFRQRSGIPLDVNNAAPALELGADREAEFFHVVQEALTNVERHARARRAWLRIDPLPAGGVRACVEDDGVGIAAPAPDGRAHHGLAIMRERAQRLGGSMQISARPGGGTRVLLVVPGRQRPWPEVTP